MPYDMLAGGRQIPRPFFGHDRGRVPDPEREPGRHAPILHVGLLGWPHQAQDGPEAATALDQGDPGRVRQRGAQASQVPCKCKLKGVSLHVTSRILDTIR